MELKQANFTDNYVFLDLINCTNIAMADISFNEVTVSNAATLFRV